MLHRVYILTVANLQNVSSAFLSSSKLLRNGHRITSSSQKAGGTISQILQKHSFSWVAAGIPPACSWLYEIQPHPECMRNLNVCAHTVASGLHKEKKSITNPPPSPYGNEMWPKACMHCGRNPSCMSSLNIHSVREKMISEVKQHRLL